MKKDLASMLARPFHILQFAVILISLKTAVRDVQL